MLPSTPNNESLGIECKGLVSTWFHEANGIILDPCLGMCFMRVILIYKMVLISHKYIIHKLYLFLTHTQLELNDLPHKIWYHRSKRLHINSISVFLFFFILRYNFYSSLSVCVKLISWDLNLDPYFPHPTSIYTCEVTTALKMCGGASQLFLKCFEYHSSKQYARISLIWCSNSLWHSDLAFYISTMSLWYNGSPYPWASQCLKLKKIQSSYAIDFSNLKLFRLVASFELFFKASRISFTNVMNMINENKDKQINISPPQKNFW